MNSLNSLEGIPNDDIVCDAEGRVLTTLLKVAGKSFYCEECGSNCFHKRHNDENRFICNSCEAEYTSN